MGFGGKILLAASSKQRIKIIFFCGNMKRLALLLLLFFVFNISAQEMPIGVQVHRLAASDGYVLFAPVIGKQVYLIDFNGRVIRQWESAYFPLSVSLLENGHLLMSVMLEFSQGATGRIEEYDWDGNLVWSFEYPDLHHDIEVLPNGNVLMTAWERMPIAEVLALGLNPAFSPIPDVTDNFGFYDGFLFEKVIEVNPASNEIVWSWSLREHLIQDYVADAPNYGAIEDFPRRINLNYTNIRLPADRYHINAISYNAARDEILLSVHYYNEVWVIDHSIADTSGEAGDLLYRWGNPVSYGRGGLANRRLFMQHDAHWLDDGRIMIFNNGLPIFRAYSTVDILDPVFEKDGTYAFLDDGAFAPEEVTTVYEGNPPNDFYALALSGAELLPNGNLVISHGTEGRIFEVNAEGEMLWEYLVPIFSYPSLLSRSPIFKARYYAADYAAFRSRELNAGESIPLTILNP
jgi:hypothetical protein